MSTSSITFQSAALEDTINIGERLGNACKGGEVFELVSDLGGGKTAFVRGLARGLNSEDDVSSPSFTIQNTYNGRLVLEHFDFYRLDDAGVMAYELSEAIQAGGVVAIEWGDIVQDILEPERIKVTISAISDSARQIDFEIPETYEHLIGEI
jgi:tRNA threonylcarbamoyladenosine biosynthesis protein TsaE